MGKLLISFFYTAQTANVYFHKDIFIFKLYKLNCFFFHTARTANGNASWGNFLVLGYLYLGYFLS